MMIIELLKWGAGKKYLIDASKVMRSQFCYFLKILKPKIIN
jgi:hypothetical protein